MPRAGLTPDRVIEEAARIADEEGWDRLSFASVAARLGVKLPSLYKHVPSLAALKDGVSTIATRELAATMATAAAGRAGGEALHAVAHALRSFATDHPGRYASTVPAPRPGDDDHIAAAADAVHTLEATISGYGLAPDDTIHAIRAVRAALHGFVSLEQSGGFGLPEDVDVSFDTLVRGLNATLARWAPSEGATALD